MKDVVRLRYASGSCLTSFDPEISEWGNLISVMRDMLNYMLSSKPGELKHLSTQRNRKQTCECKNIPLVAASEEGGAQTKMSYICNIVLGL